MVALTHFSEARHNFIKGQLIPQGIREPSLIHVFQNVSREYFLEESQKNLAYIDRDLSYGELGISRSILSSLKIAKIFHLIKPMPHQKILILGFNYGYSLALAHAWGLKVYGVEESAILLNAAYAHLVHYFDNRYGSTRVDDIVTLEHGMMREGLRQYSFYDYILIEGGVNHIPSALYEQLKETGVILGISSVKPLGLFTANKQGHKTYFGFEVASPLMRF